MSCSRRRLAVVRTPKPEGPVLIRFPSSRLNSRGVQRSDFQARESRRSLTCKRSRQTVSSVPDYPILRLVQVLCRLRDVDALDVPRRKSMPYQGHPQRSGNQRLPVACRDPTLPQGGWSTHRRHAIRVSVPSHQCPASPVLHLHWRHIQLDTHWSTRCHRRCPVDQCSYFSHYKSPASVRARHASSAVHESNVRPPQPCIPLAVLIFVSTWQAVRCAVGVGGRRHRQFLAPAGSH